MTDVDGLSNAQGGGAMVVPAEGDWDNDAYLLGGDEPASGRRGGSR
jgi:hypothetical protein